MDQATETKSKICLISRDMVNAFHHEAELIH